MIYLFESLTKNTMNINSFEIVEMNGKRLEMGLLFIFNKIAKNNVVDIYAMRKAGRYRAF